nr:hypothetical protein [Actinomadura fibrosa]
MLAPPRRADRVRRGDLAAGAGRELPARRGRPVQHLPDPLVRHLERLVQHERDPLGRRELLQDEQHRRADGVVHEHRVRDVRAGQQRLGQPRADVVDAAGAGGPEHVVRPPRRDRDEPGPQVAHAVQRLLRGGAEPHVLDDVLGVRDAAGDAVRGAEHGGPVLGPLVVEAARTRRHGRCHGRAAQAAAGVKTHFL